MTWPRRGHAVSKPRSGHFQPSHLGCVCGSPLQTPCSACSGQWDRGTWVGLGGGRADRVLWSLLPRGWLSAPLSLHQRASKQCTPEVRAVSSNLISSVPAQSTVHKRSLVRGRLS